MDDTPQSSQTVSRLFVRFNKIAVFNTSAKWLNCVKHTSFIKIAIYWISYNLHNEAELIQHDKKSAITN